MAAIIDISTGEPIATNASVASGYWARFRGLMLRRQLAPGEALDIRGDSSIHMMFMRFPIDAVFYDAQMRVTSVARGVRPWTGLAFGGRGTRGVVELSAGAAEGVEPGHQLRFVA